VDQIRSQAFSKLRYHVPVDVDDDILMLVLDQCSDRRGECSFLLQEDIHVSYGDAIHIFDQGRGKYINIHTEDGITLSWVFDTDGRLVAT
jgi:hypothetical protein